MPELPDLEVYAERVAVLAGARPLVSLRVLHPFVLRSVAPPPAAFDGGVLQGVTRLGKRLVLHFDGDRHAVIHLMRAGRLRWMLPGKRVVGRIGLAAFAFAHGTLLLTEAGTRRRASLHLVEGAAGLAAHDPGGLEPIGADPAAFRLRLQAGNHTLKRALTDPGILAGIGGAYADEILHAARLSPLALTRSLDEAAFVRLYDAVQAVLRGWCERLAAEARALPAGLPEVTAFRPQMAVHGRHGQPCPACGAPVQRIVYAETETNYCAACQTGGRILADRALSRLLKASFPRSLDELEG